MQDLWIVLISVVLLWYIGVPLLQFLTLLFYKFHEPEVSAIKRDDIPQEVTKQIMPYEKILFEKGFMRLHTLIHHGVTVGAKHRYFLFYYHHPQSGVHVLLETQPYAGALIPVRVTFESLFKDGMIVMTENGMAHTLLAVPDKIRLFDHYLPRWEDAYEKHLEDRQTHNGSLVYDAFDKEGLIDYYNDTNRMFTQSYIAQGLATKTDYGFRFSASLATWRASWKMVKGQRRLKKLVQTHARKQKDEMADERVASIVTQMDAIGTKRGESNKMVWFSGSLILFVLLYGLLGFELIDLVALVVILFVHELGHFLAMRYFGYSDTSIFFLPFGAVTLGKKEKRTAWEEYVVSMAGPLPGLLLGIGYLIYQMNSPESTDLLNLHFFAIMSIVINYINLLPIYPLDGGRIVQTLFLLRYPRVQFYFYLISIGVLSAAMLYMQDWLLLIFIVILAVGFHQNRAMVRVLKRIDPDHADKETIARAVISDEKYGSATLEFQARVAQHVHHIVQTSKPSKKLMVFGGLLYVILLMPPVLVATLSLLPMMGGSDYGHLTKAQREEVSNYYRTEASFDVLVAEGDVNLSLKSAMQRLDRFFTEQNITQPTPAKEEAISRMHCQPSDQLLTLYRWHDGVKKLFGSEDLLSIAQMENYYDSVVRNYPEADKAWLPLTEDVNGVDLSAICSKKGLYRYDSEDRPIKVYYSVAHMLQVYADVFEEKGYTKGANGLFYIKPSILTKVQRRYLLPQDRQRYEEKIAFLKKKALEYKDSANSYFRRMVVWSMSRMNDKVLDDALRLYVNDEDEDVARRARNAIRRD